MFKPDAIYYENTIKGYALGVYLLEKYKDVPRFLIDNHNNIPEMREQENTEFPTLKKHLIIGVRKTHKYEENHKAKFQNVKAQANVVQSHPMIWLYHWHHEMSTSV